MSVGAQKRALPAKVAKMKARKRQKLNDKTVQDSAAGQAESSYYNVDPDSMAWNEVAMPDKLEDYEGFFGLEEIDGVDVVRGGDGGKISYKFVESGKDLKVSEDRAANVQGNITSGELLKGATKRQLEDDEEWGGIDDGEDKEGNAPTPAAVTPFSAVKAHAKSKAKSKAQQPKIKSVIASKGNGNQSINAAFEVLEDMDGEKDADVSAWAPLKLSNEVTTALSKLKFSQPTSIQSSAIPQILAGHDLIGKAPTGSGKTLAFGIPIYEHWLSTCQAQKSSKNSAEKSPIALIILPTRELAHQITTHLTALFTQEGGDSPFIATLTGGMSIQKQRRQLIQADIIVATPGRLWEVVGEGHGVLAALKKVKFLVVDEADRLLSEGHFKELEDVLSAIDREVLDADGDDIATTEIAAKSERQTLVFSATFSKTLQQKLSKRSFSRSDLLTNEASMEYLLQKLKFREPKPCFIDVNPMSQMASTLREGMVECPGTEKDLYLYALLLYHPTARALVFVNSISAVRRLVPLLQNLNLNAYALHSQMPQKARLRSIERFSAPTPTTTTSTIGTHAAPILVATDVAARGLDIQNVHLVLHYHLPRTADTYVHRSGRTARADNSGSSILLCAAEEAAGLRRLVGQVHSGKLRASSSRKKAVAGAIRSLAVDPRVISRLRPRAALSKRLADAGGAKERVRKEDDWVRAAAEELGVDIDEVGEMQEVGGGRGRGKGRKEREKASAGMSKAEVAGVRAELRGLLAQRVNVGVSVRYLTGNSGVDVEGLLRGEGKGGFLGSVAGLGFDDDDDDA